MELKVTLKEKSYRIRIEQGLLNHVSDDIGSTGKTIVITDDGIPVQYIETVKKQISHADIFVLPHGEKSKSLATYQKVLRYMLDRDYSKKDRVLALGGGVVGDLAGFVAATYKRGISFVNIPTTSLAMVDSSIGGKVAVNMDGLKNCVGTYYQPDIVLIDPETLYTLPKRHLNNGAIEALKTGMIGDPVLFEYFLKGTYSKNMTDVIYRSLRVKADIVEKDEKESGLRKILNYGHTFGHAYESYFKMKDYLHGEAVAVGILTVSRGESFYDQLVKIFQKMKLNLFPEVDADKMLAFIRNDKKSDGETVDLILVHQIGSAEIRNVPIPELRKYLEEGA